MTPSGISYVVPIRCDDHCAGHDELRRNLEDLRGGGVDVVVVDGSWGIAEPIHREVFLAVRHLPVDIDPGVNGKVRAVHAGVAAAIHERVVVADDDVRFDQRLLERVAGRLRDVDLVAPQNYFPESRCWHAYWDTSRTLLNRALGHDYPGTLAVRRSMFIDMGGYDETALFENLELIRTVRAAGGRMRWAPDLFVPRAVPTTSAFLRQRVRQAYDDLGQPLRLAYELSLLPLFTWGLLRHRRSLGIAVLGAVALAEWGRRRHGGTQVFSWRSSAVTPLWMFERACCVWVAVWLRIFKGGVSYRGSRLRKAASPLWRLRRQHGTSSLQPHAPRHTAVSNESGHIDRWERLVDERPVVARPHR